MKTEQSTKKRYAVHSNVHPGTGKRATIGGVLEGNILSIGIAVCSPLDQFRRKTGYNKACGRALMDPEKNDVLGRDGDHQGPVRVITVSDSEKAGRTFGEIARAILDERGFPYKKRVAVIA